MNRKPMKREMKWVFIAGYSFLVISYFAVFLHDVSAGFLNTATVGELSLIGVCIIMLGVLGMFTKSLLSK